MPPGAQIVTRRPLVPIFNPDRYAIVTAGHYREEWRATKFVKSQVEQFVQSGGMGWSVSDVIEFNERLGNSIGRFFKEGAKFIPEIKRSSGTPKPTYVQVYLPKGPIANRVLEERRQEGEHRAGREDGRTSEQASGEPKGEGLRRGWQSARTEDTKRCHPPSISLPSTGAEKSLDGKQQPQYIVADQYPETQDIVTSIRLHDFFPRLLKGGRTTGE